MTDGRADPDRADPSGDPPPAPGGGHAASNRELHQLARRFRTLGLLDRAAPLLGALGWDGTIGAGLVGTVGAHQTGFSNRERRRFGIHYTPEPVARGLAALALTDPAPDARVGDPACGNGVFLLAAAERLRLAGGRVEDIIGERLFGADRDPTAVGLARLHLASWAARHTGRMLLVPPDHLQCVDGLGRGPEPGWPARPGRLEVILGNPPFGSQLRGETVRSRAERQDLQARLGVGPLGHADTAALFLVHAVASVRPGGTVCLVLPASVAAASSTRRIRRAVTERAGITAVWVGDDDVGFDASVNVWAPVLRVGSRPPERIPRYGGARVVRAGTVLPGADPTSWAPLVGDAPVGRPRAPRVRSTRPLATVASVVAGFRQHFYGLEPHVRDDPEGRTDWPRLVTTGAIDPLHHRGDEPVRFAGRRWARPVVDLASLTDDDPSLARWVEALLVPKVLVASQGRVVEAVVDDTGTMVPSTPTIAVVPRPAAGVDPWHIAALLCAPETSAALHREAGGTGLGAGTCRVSARFLGSLPLPADAEAWDRAASAARRATAASRARDGARWHEELEAVAAAFSDRAQPGRADPVARWWSRRRPEWRGARTLKR